mgnify:CR=1 FL=1
MKGINLSKNNKWNMRGKIALSWTQVLWIKLIIDKDFLYFFIIFDKLFL